MHFSFKKYQLQFKQPILTSRAQMKVKNGYFIYVENERNRGEGECSFIEGLSCDDLENYEAELSKITANPNEFIQDLEIYQVRFPSLRFGIETALLSLKSQNDRLFENDFSKGKRGIAINGLVWMGSKEFLQRQIEEKIKAGFKCIKLKIGALDFSVELHLIESIRKQFSADEIEIRLDANGAFNSNDVFDKLKALSDFGVHSIEQPVRAGQLVLMHEVCAAKIIPIALDEELIGINSTQNRIEVLDKIAPDYIILKPSLIGGLQVADEWIKLAEERKIAWWATSALESNIGLNAIAQWVASKNNPLPQGLGTGGLYLNNVECNLEILHGELWKVIE